MLQHNPSPSHLGAADQLFAVYGDLIIRRRVEASRALVGIDDFLCLRLKNVGAQGAQPGQQAGA